MQFKFNSLVPSIKEHSPSKIHMADLVEEETIQIRPKQKRMPVAQSKVELIRESPEQYTARKAKLAIKRAMCNAILLIQSHERARIGRCYGRDSI